MSSIPIRAATVGSNESRSIRSRLTKKLGRTCVLALLALMMSSPLFKGYRRVCAINHLWGRMVCERDAAPFLRKLVGDRWMPVFCNVREMYLSPNRTNEDLLWLVEFPTIKKLSFGEIFIDHDGVRFMIHDPPAPVRSRITDQGMAALKGLKDLEELSLADTHVGNEGIRELAGLTKLQVLGLDRTRVTDDGIAHLEPLQNLTLLSFRRTAVTDKGISQLAMLRRLRSLYFRNDVTTTSDGVKELLQSNPLLRVYSDTSNTEY